MLPRSTWFAILLAAAGVLTSAADRQAFQSISWTPQRIESGSPCLFKVEMAGAPSALHGKWQGRDIVFFTTGKHEVWYGLGGVDVEAKPGEYKLELEATLPDGKLVHEARAVEVNRAQYKTEKLRVPDRYVQPDAETLRRIEADKQIKKKAFEHQVPDPEWSGKFLPPIDTSVSEDFGTRRTFNGKLASIHRGLDYHAKMGSAITAANSGEVVLARELFYEGNCVILDHGQQFMTLYMHLSRLDVAEGEKVEKGQQIGLSGATGRATGPHLHMAVRWQDAYLDPQQLWALPLPKVTSPVDSTAVTK